MKDSDPVKVTPHTRWSPVVRYDSADTGVLRCEGGTDDIIFHVNQVDLLKLKHEYVIQI